MIRNYSARLSGSKRALIALLASSAVVMVGCSSMSTTAPLSANPLSTPAALSGKIHGGNQPVVGATVTLWYAGQSGPAVLAATTTTDSGGFFGFSKDPVNGNTDTGNQFSCPSNSDPLVYVVSRGGNTQNNGIATQSNSAAAFIAIYGDCRELTASNFVYMSEVTTAATMAAAVQFFDPNTDTLRADGTGQQKIVVDQLSSTIALLANSTTGLAVSTTNIAPIGGTNVASGVTVTAVPEAGKLNLIGNIISACINGATSANAACNTLFASAVPAQANTTSLNGSYPSTTTDTLQALYYMFTNPTNGQGSTGTTNLAALYSLAGGVGAPYQPAASQPTDWTLAVAYISSGTCGTPTGGTGDFINAPVDINIDGHDDVWIANSQTGGNLSAISQAGAPIACVNFDAGASNDGAVLDSTGKIWFSAGTTMYRYNQDTRATLAFPVGVSPLAITADGVGNVYFSSASGSVGSLYQIPGAATAVAAVAPIQISNQVGPNPIRMMPSYKGPAVLGDIWLSTGSTSVAQVTAGTGPGSMGGFVTNLIPAVSESSYGLAVSRSSIFVADGINGDINQLVFNGTNWVSASGWPFTSTAAGISGPTDISIDGRGNTWIPNSGSASLSEISLFGPNALSPATGYMKPTSDLNASLATAVDQAGNVWVAGSGNHFITEFVGAGVPIYQPFAVGIANGRFQQIP
ncbi:MAG TPA: hypothetical protein VNU92_15975 [Edaphobacter sp.]|nr:hypothetical protein [Edaphobacter sp.]